VFTAEEMLDEIKYLDLAVCMRYHAHVFCMLQNIPIFSVSTTRKTESVMTQAKLSDYQVQIDVEEIQSNVGANMIAVFERLLVNHVAIRRQIHVFVDGYQKLLEESNIPEMTANLLHNVKPCALF